MWIKNFVLQNSNERTFRAVKKEQKHYHFDWTLIKDNSFRFENLTACHLLKWIHFLRDTQGKNLELRYFRDFDKREVDFVVMEDGVPLQLIECKWGDVPVAPALSYLKLKYPKTEAVQIAATGTKDYTSKDGIRVLPACRFFRELI